MRFAFSEEQLMFRDAVRDLLVSECPPDVVRQAWENSSGRTADVWQKLASQGVPGMLVPESAGGLGLTELDMILVIEECGRAALPEPIVETAFVAPALLVGDVDRLGRIVAGTLAITAAPATQALFPFADGADELLVIGDHGGGLATLPGGAATTTSVDRSRRPARLAGYMAAGDQVGDAAGARLALNRGALGTAAYLVGLGASMLQVTVDYAKDRVQFGKPIGAQQAVKHHLANALNRLEFARPLVYRAAWSLANDKPDAGLHCSMAKVYANQAARLVSRTALQCHGAIGYTTEYDLHMWMKRAWALEGSWGTTADHLDRVGTSVVDTPGRAA